MILVLIIAGGCALAWWTHRQHRTCICCHRRFRTPAERARHEHVAHLID